MLTEKTKKKTNRNPLQKNVTINTNKNYSNKNDKTYLSYMYVAVPFKTKPTSEGELALAS